MNILYIFWGKIKSGAKRGRTLGFPTANITLRKKIPEGIYISQVTLCHSERSEESKKKIPGQARDDKTTYPAATFIGNAKTFNEKDYKAEVYILDFDNNIYNKWLSVKLFKKIRDNQKFVSEKELIVQMEKDVSEVRKFFNDKDC